MKTKIGKVETFDLYYDTGRRKFCLENAEGDEVATAQTQAEVEEQAKQLLKKQLSLPIPAFRVSSHAVIRGRITSINPSERSAWFVADKGEHGTYGSGREKVDFRYLHLYQVTPANEETAKAIKERLNAIALFGKEIADLIKKLEKHINEQFFNLT